MAENRIDAPDIPGIGGVLSVYLEETDEGEKVLRASWREIDRALRRGWIVGVFEVTEESVKMTLMDDASVSDGVYSVTFGDTTYTASGPKDQPSGGDDDVAKAGTAIVGTSKIGGLESLDGPYNPDQNDTQPISPGTDTI